MPDAGQATTHPISPEKVIEVLKDASFPSVQSAYEAESKGAQTRNVYMIMQEIL